jgi:hypothetical protein
MTPPSNPDKPTLESAKRSIEVDYSPAAVERRLDEFFELWNFWQCLRKFKPVEKPDENRSAATGSCDPL